MPASLMQGTHADHRALALSSPLPVTLLPWQIPSLPSLLKGHLLNEAHPENDLNLQLNFLPPPALPNPSHVLFFNFFHALIALQECNPKEQGYVSVLLSDKSQAPRTMTDAQFLFNQYSGAE